MKTNSCFEKHTDFDDKFLKSIFTRIVRLETKLVRGFEELGVNIDNNENWLVIDEASRSVFLTTLGRSPMVIMATMREMGAKCIGEEYTIYYKNNYFGKMILSLPG